MEIISYFMRKGKEYFFPEIDGKVLKRALKILTKKEKETFMEMDEYDRMHSLEVYKKVCKTEIKNDVLYLKLALLHDCGKGKTPILLRSMHKFGVKTRLTEHPLKGYEKVRNYNEELALLIKNHHRRSYSEKMDIFQKCDDEC